MSRLSRRQRGLMLLVGLWLTASCSSTPQSPLDLTTRDPTQDQWRIASYYSQEAVVMRRKAEELTTRAAQYERLFGPTSDWVTGARLLAQFYEEAGREHERLAGVHVGIAQGESPSSHPRGGTSDHNFP